MFRGERSCLGTQFLFQFFFEELETETNPRLVGKRNCRSCAPTAPSAGSRQLWPQRTQGSQRPHHRPGAHLAGHHAARPSGPAGPSCCLRRSGRCRCSAAAVSGAPRRPPVAGRRPTLAPGAAACRGRRPSRSTSRYRARPPARVWLLSVNRLPKTSDG